MIAERLSALDASFLAVEGADAPMHVGWVAQFDPPERGPRPAFDELFEHIAGRLGRAPRYRQRLAGVPLAVHDPVWVDDARFDASAHLLRADGEDLDGLVDAVLSSPLRRDRPLWEIAIADELPEGRITLVGKMHHCMVDGVAVVELGNLLLDAVPGGLDETSSDPGWTAARVPSAGERLARAVVDRAGDGAALLLAPARTAVSPRRLRRLPGAAARGARTLGQLTLPPAPSSPLNRPGSANRHHVRVTRTLDEIRAVRRRFGVTPNDVMLAACAGALRRFAERDGAAEDLDATFQVLARTPTPLQHALAHAFAHPRLFNLTISSVPGPAVPRYLRGCRLREVHSAVPLTGRHALSIGVVTVARNACFGITADAVALPDADALGAALDDAIDELSGARGAP